MAESSLIFSVVLISWNQLAFLKRLIVQLQHQDFPRDEYEIIIVDDGSSDGSRQWIESVAGDSNIHFVFGNENKGRSASRNAGILAAQGKIIVMIDGDHTVKPDFLACHRNYHTKELCAVIGRSEFADHPDYRALNFYLNEGGAYKLPRGAKLPGRYFLTRNCSVPKDVLIKVGMFDETFTAWGGEDLDLGKKIEKTGIPIYGAPDAIAVHHHLRPLDAVLENLYIYGRDGIPILLTKHPELFRELNLDHSVKAKSFSGRYGTLHRIVFRFFFLKPFYLIVKWKAHLLRRIRLPRMIFDYLHLRQYTKGYLDYLRTQNS